LTVSSNPFTVSQVFGEQPGEGMMTQETLHADESGSSLTVEISIINETALEVEICRVHPAAFTEENLFVLAAGDSRKATVCVTDCLLARVGNEVISQIGVCAGLPEWRLHDVQRQRGCRGPMLVENHRAEPVSLFCTEGDHAEAVMIRILPPGEQAVLQSFLGDYWEAMAGERVVSAYQLSARLPVWAITDVDCDFVPELSIIGNENLNETSAPRPIDLVATGDVKAVMVFIDFPDVRGTASPEQIKQRIIGDAPDWFRRESYGRLRFSVDTPVLQWRRMPESAPTYAAIKASWASHQSYISTALKLFSPEEIDFNAYQIAYVVAVETPADDPRYEGVLDNSPTLSAGIDVETNKGTVHHAVTFGRDSYHRGCRVLVHETGHLFGLPDLYLFHADPAGSILAPAGAWDIMCDLDQGRHFLGWHKYKLGWLDESQLIFCTAGEVAVTLASLEPAHGVKMIVLPSAHSSQLYVVEAAQALGDSGREKGLLIYSVDASVATGHQPVSVLDCGAAEEDAAVGLHGNAYLAPGKSRLVELPNGARVEVTNRKRIGAGFEVAVKSFGAGQSLARQPQPCPHCDPTGERSVWLK
jgi:M6 family metalloprotease-like protein